MRDCITMCFDICTINIRVSIRVRGLHLVFLSPGKSTTPINGKCRSITITTIQGIQGIQGCSTRQPGESDCWTIYGYLWIVYIYIYMRIYIYIYSIYIHKYKQNNKYIIYTWIYSDYMCSKHSKLPWQIDWWIVWNLEDSTLKGDPAIMEG